MKKQLLLLVILLSIVGTKAWAYDISVNSDGETFYYNYINDGKELEVAHAKYSGSLVIPEEVTYMNRTRKVTSIGNYAFSGCNSLLSVTIPNSVTSIGEHAFYECSRLSSVTIPNSVTSIGSYAFFNCNSLSSVTIPNSVTSIEEGTFQYCNSLSSITIFNSVTSIGNYAFQYCSRLSSVTIPNSVTSIGNYAFQNCTNLLSVTIPNSVTSIGNFAFEGCICLLYVTIPNSVTSIGESTFKNCRNLISVTIPNSMTSIGEYAFYKCSSLTSVTIPNSVTSIGKFAFEGWELPKVISKIENPFKIAGKSSNCTFSLKTFNNATLYVPVGTIDKYKATEGWKDFMFIEEGDGGGDTPPVPKCEEPTISYSGGKLTFSSATEGATCHYSITDSDIKSGSSNEVQLVVTYNISVYATKSGYWPSETATATLCWIDVDPKTEGITNGVTNVPANAVLIRSNDGMLNIQGLDEGTQVIVYTVDGKLAGSATSLQGEANINTTLRSGNIAVVKMGEKSIKVVMK